ncbi:MAG: site-specific integrase [Muribaculaceae bacterium]|nr:site-specific integrase [Muribaculaceae bacterium]
MATIKVKFRASETPDYEGSIFYQVTVARTTRIIATEYKVYKNEWNEHRAMVRCSKESPRFQYVLSVQVNIRFDLERLARVTRILNRNSLDYTADDLISEYQCMTEKNSLFRYIDNIIAKLKSNGKVRTSETYKTALNSFSKYRGGKDIMLDCVNNEIMESYEAWLRERGTSPNTVSFYARILRAVYNRAVEEDLTDDRSPFKKVYTGIEKTVKRALPMRTIKKIKGLDLTDDPKMDYARDMFILSFMLRGMSFIDMAFLKKENLRNGYITYRRRKTGQILTIQWTPEMQELVGKYPANDNAYLLPIIRNQQALPIYCYRNICYNVNKHLKMIGRMLCIPITLTMYVARHSWASAAKAKGIPISVISEGMGHNSESTTQIYLASLDTSVVDKANLLLMKDLGA